MLLVENPVDYDALKSRSFPNVDAFKTFLIDELGLSVDGLRFGNPYIEDSMGPLAQVEINGEVRFTSGSTISMEGFGNRLKRLSVSSSASTPTGLPMSAFSLTAPISAVLSGIPIAPEAGIGEVRGVLIGGGEGYSFKDEEGRIRPVSETGVASLHRVWGERLSKLLEGGTRRHKPDCRPSVLAVVSADGDFIDEFVDPEDYNE